VPAAAVALVALVLLGGCTAGSEEEPDTSQSSTEAAAEAEAEQLDEAAETLSSGSPSAEPTPIEELPVVATRAASAGGLPIEVDLNGVRVSGTVMTVLFTVRNEGQERLDVNQTFDDGLQNALGEDADGFAVQNAFTADGVYVLDGVNTKRHTVARDTTGRCVCSGALSGVGLETGQEAVLTATFTAVPEGVETVSVAIPLVGEFADVPVTR
jgi:hypothetical protein